MINIVKCLVFSVTAIGIFFQSNQISDAIVAEIELFYTTFCKNTGSFYGSYYMLNVDVCVVS